MEKKINTSVQTKHRFNDAPSNDVGSDRFPPILTALFFTSEAKNSWKGPRYLAHDT